MLEITGSASKIEGLVQILRESNCNILEMARTGRMAMRRGHHTSRVMDALTDISHDSKASALAKKTAMANKRKLAALSLNKVLHKIQFL